MPPERNLVSNEEKQGDERQQDSESDEEMEGNLILYEVLPGNSVAEQMPELVDLNTRGTGVSEEVVRIEPEEVLVDGLTPDRSMVDELTNIESERTMPEILDQADPEIVGISEPEIVRSQEIPVPEIVEEIMDNHDSEEVNPANETVEYDMEGGWYEPEQDTEDEDKSPPVRRSRRARVPKKIFSYNEGGKPIWEGT